MRRNKTNVALNSLKRTEKTKEKSTTRGNCIQCKQKQFDWFYMVSGGVHLAGVACVAATMENWNDDKSNFIKYRYTSPKQKKQCPVRCRLFFFHSFVRLFVEISIGIHLLQQIECGCNHTYHTTKFLFMVSSCCLSAAAMCQSKYNPNAHAYTEWCVQS